MDLDFFPLYILFRKRHFRFLVCLISFSFNIMYPFLQQRVLFIVAGVGCWSGWGGWGLKQSVALCVRTRTHEPQSRLPLVSHTPRLHMFTLNQPRLFVSEALFSPPSPQALSSCQINIAPEIAGIAGIFQGVLAERRRRPEQGSSLWHLGGEW